MSSVQLMEGDVIAKLAELPNDSVHCVVTSPPYWSLRDYGVIGQMGLEATIEEYIERMVCAFRQVRRVLRADGTLWLNMGDVYATSKASPGIKPKDLVGLPWMLAFALRADGWYLRSENIWHKTNAMPESVADRPSRAHETVFLLSKSQEYFYDREAVKQPRASKEKAQRIPANWATGPGSHGRFRSTGRNSRFLIDRDPRHAAGEKSQRLVRHDSDLRNLRSVWTVATEASGVAHFATFPKRLILPCILSGTSEWGCCPVCAAQFRRIVDVEYINPGNRQTNGPRSLERRHAEYGTAGFARRLERISTTAGWEPSCDCHETMFAQPGRVACTVLDPFMGRGTTGIVAVQHGRSFIGNDLKPEYVALARQTLCPEVPMESVA